MSGDAIGPHDRPTDEELVAAADHLFQELDCGEQHPQLEALRAAVLAGEHSGVAEGDVFAELRERIRRRASTPGSRGPAA